LELVPINPKPATAIATVAPVTVATIEATSTQQVATNVRMDGDAEYYRSLLLKEFDDMLVDNLRNELPPLREINHRIPYKPMKPWVAYKYRLSEMHKKALEKDIIPKLESGILWYTSEIPLAAWHVVPKHELGEFQHVQGLRKRKEDTESMAWPLPDQDELIHKIVQSSNALKFDLISAFD